jgi:hypothetical protein
MPIQPLGNVQARYDDYISGCIDFYNKHDIPKGDRCIRNERDRIEMTLRQPQSVYNYTKTGYTKIRAPDHVFKLIRDFWDKNRGKETPETWHPANIYTNHWKAPTYMLSVENAELDGAGYVLKQHIWNAARDTIEEWTGYKQAECSLYGIRIYRDGAMLAPHVDRMPLVSSAIINVDQDLDEPWPLEVIGHDGKATNITMEPGGMCRLALMQKLMILPVLFLDSHLIPILSRLETWFCMRAILLSTAANSRSRDDSWPTSSYIFSQ